MSFLLTFAAPATASGADLLDNLESAGAWQVITTPGASASVDPDRGRDGKSLRIDFDFSQGGGEIMVHKAFPLPLPENFVLSFDARAEDWERGLELRLVDDSGQNVWRFRDAKPHIGREWQTFPVKRRRLEFAWGPAAGGNPARLGLVEFVIPRGKGGRGSLWIDNLRLTASPPQQTYAGTPELSASEGAPTAALLDQGAHASWRARETKRPPWLQLDFKTPREYGGLVVDWAPEDYATAYTVETSDDGKRWHTSYAVTHGNGGRDYVPLPESESRYLRLRLQRSSRRGGYAIRHLQAQALDFSSPPERLFARLARENRAGYYPRYFSEQQSYWTLVGTPGNSAAGAECEALLSEDGILEAHGAAFSVEPFLRENGILHTWADGENHPSLEQGYLPIPSVRWERSVLALDVTAIATDRPQGCAVSARYRLTNRGQTPVQASLFLAVRPLPVTPPWQALTPEAALSPIHGLSYKPGILAVDGEARVLAWPAPNAAGVTNFDGEPLAASLALGKTPIEREVRDSLGFASGAMRFDMQLAPGDSREAVLSMPPTGRGEANTATDSAGFQADLADATRRWHRELDRVELQLPPGEEDLGLALRSNLAYILINRSGAAVRPGSRRYGRTWIRDGAVASAGLLALGHAAEARSFLEWFAGFQQADGSVPCCLDPWGPDAMIEHDSAGEFLYAAATYYDYSRDLGFLRAIWPKLAQAVEHLENLRRLRMTPGYQDGDAARFHGLLPESASHEGYMARPVHSYWDDFWAVRGLGDAACLAAVLGDDRAAHFAELSHGLRKDLHKSIVLTQAKFGIDYVPGAAELGDFDPASSAVAVTVAGEAEGPLRPSLLRTFARFSNEIIDRLAGKSNWQGYAPYELRNVSALVRLGERDAAYRALRFLLEGRRPAAWNQWPEVVWRDPRLPRFLGDMPHSWIGAEYIQALLSLFVYEDAQRRLVLAAGLPASWLNTPGGVGIRNIETPYGALSYQVEPVGPGLTTMRVESGLAVPAGGLLVALPGLDGASQVHINGKHADVHDNFLVLDRTPAIIEIRSKNP